MANLRVYLEIDPDCANLHLVIEERLPELGDLLRIGLAAIISTRAREPVRVDIGDARRACVLVCLDEVGVDAAAGAARLKVAAWDGLCEALGLGFPEGRNRHKSR